MDAIEHAERLVHVFGEWPTFHDAEVLELTLRRSLGDELSPPTLQLDLHAWALTDRTDATGVGVIEHDSFVRLEFRGVEALALDGFNHQNVLGALEIRERGGESVQAPRAFEVGLDAIFGVGAVFACTGIAVLQVTPWEEFVRSGAV